MISKAVYNILSTNAGVTALLGTKIYPVKTPQAVQAPFAVYLCTTEPVDTKDGVVTQEVVDCQITIFSGGYESAQSIKAAIRTALDRVSGTYKSNKIQTIIFVDDRDGLDEKSELFKVDMLFSIRLNK